VLGSCVAACLFDPRCGIGGMNHFMLPYHTLDPAVSARYGVHAMEMLINEIMRLGGDRRRLQAKVFGASRLLQFPDSPWNVARRNAQFVRDFCRMEGIPIIAERLEQEVPLRVHFLTNSGQAFVKTITKSIPLADQECRYSKQAADQVTRPKQGAVTLF
jgi:chemotaxis protein CheD